MARLRLALVLVLVPVLGRGAARADDLDDETPTATIQLRGRVLDRKTSAPAARVIVTIGDAPAATTDNQGQFTIDLLPIGPQAVVLELDGARETQTVDVRGEDPAPITLYLDTSLAGEVIEVRGEAPETRTTAVVVDSKQAAQVAGSAGDALKVVANLPGVARAATGSGALVIWGSAPEESRVYVDGVELPALYHIGGHRSVLPSPMVKNIELRPGAYGAEFGRTVGGVVDVASTDLPATGTHGVIAADLLDTAAFVTIAPTTRFRAGAGARFGYLDRVLSSAIDEDARALIPVPRYYDAQARVEALATGDRHFELTALSSGDRIDRSVGSADPAETRAQSSSIDSLVIYGRYRRENADGERARLIPFVSYRRQSEGTRFGVTRTELSSQQWGYGLRADAVFALTERLRVTAGFDGAGTRAQYTRLGTLTLPAREGDIAVFGQPPGPDVNADDWTTDTIDAAPYTTLDARAGAFGIRAGMRIAAVLHSTSRKAPPKGRTPPIGFTGVKWLPEPRLSITWEPRYEFALRLDAGLHHQAPDASDLSAVFGTPTLEPLRAQHGALGAIVRLPWNATLQPVLFVKRLTDLPARSANTMPRLAEALVQNGEGRSYGAQLLVRQENFHGVTGWLAYTISRSERRRAGEPGHRLLDFDQTHVLTAVAGYQLGDWSFGTRLRVATGMPRTPVLGAVYDSGSDQFQPMFGPQSSSRLPLFFQLDARAERAFHFGPDAQLRVSLDVQNITNRKNAEEVVYSFDYTQRDYLTGLPILAVLGAAFEF